MSTAFKSIAALLVGLAIVLGVVMAVGIPLNLVM